MHKKNIFLEIEYEGTNYFGFQVQNKEDREEITIQKILEEAIEKLFRQKIKLRYAGRTDRGVHAYCQGGNFIVVTTIPSKNIKNALNTMLPRDIRIKKVKSVPLDFDMRFSVKEKIYRYVILHKKEQSVFFRNFSWHINKPLNQENMEKAAKKLIGRKDFSLFAKEVKRYKDCVRDVKDINIKKRGVFIYIDIKANGFLRHMARNIVGFLVKIGEGKIELEKAEKILKRRITYSNTPAPACGLYLYKVKY